MGWTATSNNAAITVTPAQYAGEDKTVTATIAANDFGVGRSAAVTFTSSTDSRVVANLEVTILADESEE